MNDHTRKVLHSSKKDDWGTPDWLFELLDKQYHFTLDLCATVFNTKVWRYCADVQSKKIYSRGVDCEIIGIDSLNWGKEVFFCNPPYGKKWREILPLIPLNQASGIFLLPSRTGSRWFLKMMQEASWVFFLQGRLTFNGAVDTAPFDSVLFGCNLPAVKGLNGKCIRL